MGVPPNVPATEPLAQISAVPTRWKWLHSQWRRHGRHPFGSSN
jgi:hypothetical protein